MMSSAERTAWQTVPWHGPSMSQPPVDAFVFEEQVQLTEAEFVALRRLPPLPARHSVVPAAFGVACLFWSYTLVLGALLLLGAAMVVATRWIGLSNARQAWKDTHRHLQAPVTFGVSHRGVWRRSDGIRVSFAWSRLSGWRILDGWLQLASVCGGVVYLRMASLEKSGVRDAVFRCVAHVGRAGSGSEGHEAAWSTDGDVVGDGK